MVATPSGAIDDSCRGTVKDMLEKYDNMAQSGLVGCGGGSAEEREGEEIALR